MSTSDYIDRPGREVKPTLEPTIVPNGHCVVGIHLQDLGDHNTLGFEILCETVSP